MPDTHVAALETRIDKHLAQVVEVFAQGEVSVEVILDRLPTDIAEGLPENLENGAVLFFTPGRETGATARLHDTGCLLDLAFSVLHNHQRKV